jgi:iron complex transport system substrate-binding protein
MFRRSKYIALSLGALALFALACGGEEKADSSAKPGDSAETTQAAAPLKAEAVRVVALSGGITETVYALGVGSKVVGVDASSHFPAETAKVPRFNYHRKLSTEPILAQKPSLVLASKDSGPPAVIEQLKAAGIRVEVFDEPANFEDAKTRITKIGAALGKPDEAAKLVAKMDADLAKVKKVENGPSVLGLYARGPKTLMVAGKSTVLETMVSLAGGKNVPAGFDGFKPLTPEVVVGAAPEVLLISTHGLQSLGGKDGLAGVPALADTPAVKNKRIIAIDDAILLSFGPRSASAVESIASQLAPVGE